ncbi:MAG: ribonuclease H-like domain-containing protein [Roseburia sp.]|nr:ribonuclease H-like domain-containing protein [Roseburia sp.]
MHITDRAFDLQTNSISTLHTWQGTKADTFCFFDIETTGLSAKVSSLYLIGVLWYDQTDKKIHTKQWFADDYISEKEILCAFTEFISGFTTVVHYNGSGFDIPYIEKKCRELELPTPFHDIKSLDLYREIRPLKPLFKTPDLKLFTVEKLAGFMRKDILSGKECIEVYSRFMQKKYFRDSSMETEKQKLLLHNIEDIIGTFYCAEMLSYRCSMSYKKQTVNPSLLQIDFLSKAAFPSPVKWKSAPYALAFHDHTVTLEISLYSGELRHFFKDYKNYFYLPAEDTAIHKSVGTYVEKEFRRQAKASECYVKKEGLFLPLPSGIEPQDLPLFRPDYRSRQNYLLWDEKVQQDLSLWEEILHQIINTLSRSK